MFCTFSLPNLLFATAVCIFSTSELQKVLRGLKFFNIFMSTCAFRHSGVHFSTSNFQKCSEDYNFLTFSCPHVLFADYSFFYIFMSTCAFRHSGVHFFDIGTSKSAPKLTCFVHFHFKMRLSPQRRGIFDLSSDHLPPHPPL